MNGRHRLRAAIALGVALITVAVVAPFLASGQDYEIVFRQGAARAEDPGEVFATIPHRRVGDVVWLELEPGDSIVLRNLDDEIHQVAGITARPGETVLHTFRERGVLSSACSLDITVFVEVDRR